MGLVWLSARSLQQLKRDFIPILELYELSYQVSAVIEFSRFDWLKALKEVRNLSSAEQPKHQAKKLSTIDCFQPIARLYKNKVAVTLV